jgi:hypothetical protein
MDHFQPKCWGQYIICITIYTGKKKTTKQKQTTTTNKQNANGRTYLWTWFKVRMSKRSCPFQQFLDMAPSPRPVNTHRWCGHLDLLERNWIKEINNKRSFVKHTNNTITGICTHYQLAVTGLIPSSNLYNPTKRQVYNRSA